jgi:hypothetical protein
VSSLTRRASPGSRTASLSRLERSTATSTMVKVERASMPTLLIRPSLPTAPPRSCRATKGASACSGVNIGHVEFEGRAKWGKTIPKDPDQDLNGHGSHVAVRPFARLP